MSVRVSDVLNVLYPGSLKYVPEDALDRGRRLHEYMEFYVNSLMQGMKGPPMDNLDPQEQRRATAMIDWLADQRIVFESTEERVDHSWGYIGHPDLLGTWKGRPYCFDYKFAAVLTEQNELQGEAYRHLTNRPVALVQCKQNGTIVCKKLKPRPDLWAAFLSGLQVKKFHNRQKKELTHVA